MWILADPPLSVNPCIPIHPSYVQALIKEKFSTELIKLRNIYEVSVTLSTSEAEANEVIVTHIATLNMNY